MQVKNEKGNRSDLNGFVRHWAELRNSGMIYAAEYVFAGHPDKLCDAITDALVEEAAREARVVWRSTRSQNVVKV